MIRITKKIESKRLQTSVLFIQKVSKKNWNFIFSTMWSVYD